MPLDQQIIPLTGGIDQSIVDYKAPKGSLYMMMNMRHSATMLGRIETTPFFYQYYQLARGTYYNAGSQTESATSSVNLVTKDFYMTDECFSTGVAQIKSFFQTTQPAAETIYTGLRLVINDVAGFGIALGSTLDVEMTATAVFKYRKNGGAYTTGVVPSTAGVSIDGGNATLYFLANTGFAGTETWSWTRTDRAYNGTVNSWVINDYQYYKGNLYFIGRDSRIMCGLKDNNNLTYVISVGYRAVYGQSLCFFFDHLVIGGFSKTAFSYLTNPQGKTVGWSDVTDVHCFVPTDVNEADSYTLPNDSIRDVLSNTTTALFVNDVAVIQNVLYVFSSFGTYRTGYLGLPTVFSFEHAMDVNSPQAPVAGTVNCPEGVYTLTQDDVILYTGSSITSIGAPIVNFIRELGQQLTYTAKCKFTGLLYNASTRELILRTFDRSTILVYQEKFKTWYARTAYCAGGLGIITAIGLENEAASYSQNVLVLGLPSRFIYKEDVAWANQPAYLDTAGTTYAVPYIITHPFGDSLALMKELEGVYIGASLLNATTGGAAPSGTYYSTAANIRLNIAWMQCNAGLVDETINFTTDTAAYWDSSKPDGTISIPRLSFRSLALKIYITGQTALKPPGYITITALELLLRAVVNNPTR